MTIDYVAAASFLAMDFREDRDQIDAMERNTRFPVEEIQKRRARLKIKAQAVKIVRIVAGNDAIRELVEQQMGAGA